jgi:hypothetical protein
MVGLKDRPLIWTLDAKLQQPRQRGTGGKTDIQITEQAEAKNRSAEI